LRVLSLAPIVPRKETFVMDAARLGPLEEDRHGHLTHPRYTRKVLGLRTIIAVKEGLGSGKTINISSTGCRLHLRKPLRRGQYLTLKLYPDDGSATVQIDLAKVTWVEEDSAGIAFLSLSEPQRKRLDRLCGDRIE